ncbi:MAG: aminoacyl-tRNA hydrolase, partial [Bacteroidota bacterium]
MTAIVGLGNPGNKYEWTRHNVGFFVVDALRDALRTEFEAGKGDYLLATAQSGGTPIALVKPLTHMNNSGLAVADLVERYDLDLRNVLIICDDFNLPLGKLRLRPKGSDGGHNGLYSIIYQLQTEEFPRLRCGIGTATSSGPEFDATSFVLSDFGRDEKPVVRNMVENARDAALCVLSEGVDVAMDRWNATGHELGNEKSAIGEQPTG